MANYKAKSGELFVAAVLSFGVGVYLAAGAGWSLIFVGVALAYLSYVVDVNGSYEESKRERAETRAEIRSELDEMKKDGE